MDVTLDDLTDAILAMVREIDPTADVKSHPIVNRLNLVNKAYYAARGKAKGATQSRAAPGQSTFRSPPATTRPEAHYR